MKSKKVLAIVLAIAMVFGVVSMASAASVTRGGFADSADGNQANQIAYLRAIGIAKGDENGNFNPNANLTRQEFVTFVARLAGQEDAAEFLSGVASQYLDDEDIADWARGPVNLADTNGWVLGYDDGKFHPTDSLTYAQAVTVLIRVLGHEPSVTGAWPNAHIVKGINLGLNAGVSLSANTPITRADMGRLLYNALFTKQLVKKGDDYEEGSTLMSGRTLSGVVDDVDSSSIVIDKEDPVGGAAPPAKTERALADEVTLIGAANLAALKGLTVQITTADIKDSSKKVTVIQVTGDATGSAAVFKEYEETVDSSFATVHNLVMQDDSKVAVVVNADTDKATSFRINRSDNQKGHLVNVAALDALLDDSAPATNPWFLAAGDQVSVSLSGGKAKHLEITRFNVANLASDDGHVRQKADEDPNYIEVNNTKYFTANAVITLNGQPATVGDLKENDFVRVATTITAAGAATDQAIVVEATRNVLSGTVEDTRTTYPGPRNYATVKLADGSSKEVRWTGAGTLVKGMKVELILNHNGVAVANTGKTSGVTATTAVKLLSGSNVGGGTITVDRNGTEVTFGITSAVNLGTLSTSGLYGTLVMLGFETDNVTVNAVNAVTIKETAGVEDEVKIISFDSASGVVTYRAWDPTANSGAGDFATTSPLTSVVKPATYSINAAGEIGKTATLKAGDIVYLGIDGSNNVVGLLKF